MDPVFERLFQPNVFIPLFIVSAIVITSVVKSIAKCIVSSARERTRREIAAYIAEGSLSAEQGERLMKASDPNAFGGCNT